MMKQGNLDLEGSFKQTSFAFQSLHPILGSVLAENRINPTPFTSKQPDNTISIINSRNNSNCLITLVAPFSFNIIWQWVYNNNPNEINNNKYAGSSWKSYIHLSHIYHIYTHMIFMKRNICIHSNPIGSYWMNRCFWSSEECYACKTAHKL